MPQLVVEMSGDEERLFRSFQRITAAEKKVEAGLKKIKTTGQGASKQLERGFKKTDVAMSKIAGTTAKLIGAIGGVGFAMREVNRMFAERVQLGKEALELEVQIAKAQSVAIKNLGTLPTAEKRRILEREVPRIARETGFGDIGGLSIGVGAAFSAGATSQQAVDAVKQSAKLNILTPEAVDEFAAAAVDIGKSTGLGAKENLAILASTGQISRVESPEKLAVNLPKALTPSVASAPTQDRIEAAKQTAAIFGVLGQRANDTQGDSTATATIKLTQKLNEFFATRLELDDPGTIRGRLDAIANNEGLRKEFLKSPFGEAAFVDSFKQLVTKGSEARKQLDAAQPRVVATPDSFEKLVRETQSGTESTQIATSQARVKAKVNQFNRNRSSEGLARDIVKRVDTAVESSRGMLERIGRAVDRGPFAFFSDTEQEFESRVHKGQDPLEAAHSTFIRKSREEAGLGPAGVGGARFEFPTDEELAKVKGERRRRAELLKAGGKELETLMREQAENQKEQLEVQKKQLQAMSTMSQRAKEQQMRDLVPSVRQQQAVPTE